MALNFGKPLRNRRGRTPYRARPQNGSSSFAPCPYLPQTYSHSLTRLSPHSSTVNPTQIFVGGFGLKACERELRDFFSLYGTVREVKIVADHYGISKGFGFITFATKEEALNVLIHADRIYEDKKLSIAQAVYRQTPRHNGRFQETYYSCSVAPPMSREPANQTTYLGAFYTYYNGEAYFFNLVADPPAHHLLPPPSETPLQSYSDTQQMAYHYTQPPARFSPFTFSQQSEYISRSDGGSVVPPVPYTDTPAENLTFPHSWASLNSKYRRDIRHGVY